MDFGAELQQARQRAGLSREEVSQRTKIQPAKIDALERNAFERLPEGIYLDGIVRAYAKEVGLDPDEAVQDARIARHHFLERGAAAGSVPELAHDERAGDFDTYAKPPDAVAPPAEFARLSADPDDRAAAAPQFERARPRRRSGMGLILPVLALVAAAGWGAYLYEMSRPYPQAAGLETPALSPENEAAAERHGAPPAGDATVSRGAQDALGAQGASGAAGASGAPGASGAQGAAGAPTATTTAADRGGRPTEGARSTAGRDAAVAASPAARPEGPTPLTEGETTAAPAAESAAVTRPGTASRAEPTGTRDPAVPRAADVSGYWTLDTRVESSSYTPFAGLQLGYRVQLLQNGTRITGTGSKIAENGTRIGESAQTPIALEGTFDGHRMTLTFVEQGTRRQTSGKMILDVYEDGVLRGRFSSSAASSSGLVEARRPEG